MGLTMLSYSKKLLHVLLKVPILFVLSFRLLAAVPASHAFLTFLLLLAPGQRPRKVYPKVIFLLVGASEFSQSPTAGTLVMGTAMVLRARGQWYLELLICVPSSLSFHIELFLSAHGDYQLNFYCLVQEPSNSLSFFTFLFLLVEVNGMSRQQDSYMEGCSRLTINEAAVFYLSVLWVDLPRYPAVCTRGLLSLKARPCILANYTS